VDDADLDYNNKLHCVDEFAKRWWYALPAWPPANFDYIPVLTANGLRAVDSTKWKSEPELDKKGLKKVHVVEYYGGMFKDSHGNTYDLRPRESMPSLRNFQAHDSTMLRQMLLKAYQAQYK